MATKKGDSTTTYRRMRTVTGFLLTLFVVLVPLAQTACNKDHIREARKAAYRVQVVTDAAIDTTATLFHDGVLDKVRTNQIAKILLKLNSANSVFIEKAAAATEDSPSVRADLIAQLRVVEDAVKELKALGVLGIKSRDGSLAFDSAIRAIDTALAVIEAALAGGGK